MTSSVKLPLLIASFIATQNNHDPAAFAKLFAEDAIVKDEGEVLEGMEQIKTWNEMTNKKYHTHMEALDCTDENDTTIVTILMSGTFLGSPLQARFYFQIKNEAIQSLSIK